MDPEMRLHAAEPCVDHLVALKLWAKKKKKKNFPGLLLLLYKMVNFVTILLKLFVRIGWVDVRVCKCHSQCLTHSKHSTNFNCVITGQEFCFTLVSRFRRTYWESVAEWLRAQTLKLYFLGWSPDPTLYLLCDFSQTRCSFVCLSFPICKVGTIIGILKGCYVDYWINTGRVFRKTLIHTKFYINVSYHHSFPLLFRSIIVWNQNNFSFSY